MNKLKLTLPLPLIMVFLVVISLVSCIKEEINLDKVSDKSTINGTFVGPMLNAEFAMDDLIEAFDSVAVVKYYPEDSLLYIQYKTDIVSERAEDFVQINNQQFVEVIQSNYPNFPVILPATFSSTIIKNFDVANGEKIDSIIFKSGSLLLNIQSTFRNTGSIKFTVPNLKKGGNQLQVTVPINVADGTFNYTHTSIDLAGYKLVSTEGGVPNQVKIIYEVTLQSGSPILSNYALTITANINSPKFSELYGYLGKRVLIDDTGVLSMNIFDVNDESKIVFADPHLKFYSRNSFGVPLGVDLYNMRTYSVLNNTYYNLTVPTPQTVHAALALNTIAYDTAHIDKSNSNLVQAMETVPRDLHYGFRATMNPVGEPKNFVTDASRLDAEVDMELPLEMRLDKYEISDTLDFDLGLSEDDLSMVDSLTVYVKFQNGFPLEAASQFYFIDSLGVIIDSLFNQQPILKAADIAASGPRKGRVIHTNPYEVNVKYNSTRIKNFINIKKAVLKASLFSKGYAQNAFVKFYLNDKLKVSMGAKVSINKTND